MQSKLALTKSTIILLVVLLFSFSQSEDICASNAKDCENICSEYNLVMITSLNTIIDIKNVNEIFVDEIINIQNYMNTSISILEFNLNCDYQNLTVDDGNEELDIEVSGSSGIITTTLKETLLSNESIYIHMTYMLITEIPRAEGNPPYYYFLYDRLF